eukprot:jgi/Mesvir1/11560/Mv17931-RA.2
MEFSRFWPLSIMTLTICFVQVMSTAGLPVPILPATNPDQPAQMNTGCVAFHQRGALQVQPASVPEDIPTFLKDYAKFHHTCLLRMAATPRHIPLQVRFLVFHCIPGQCGGIGDRLKGIMGAFYLAVVTQRVFIIQHTEFPLTDSLVPNAIDWHSLASCLPSYKDRGRSRFLDAFHPPLTYMVGGKSPDRGGVFDADRLISDVLKSNSRVVHLRLNHPIWNQILDSRMASTLVASQGPSQQWSMPQGPRFAWGWHLLFRPSEGMEQELAQHKRALGIPTNGTPWVAVHIRAGTSEQFKDDWINVQFCNGLQQGVAPYTACATQLTQLVTQPPFAKRNPSLKPLNPHSVPIFIASDSSEAAQVMRDQLLAEGHHESDISYTGRQAVHAGRLPRANATTNLQKDAMRRAMMLTVAELLLLSHATCIVMEKSGFANTAEWMSRDLRTGARCAAHAFDCHPERVQALARPREEERLNDRTRLHPMEKFFLPVCSYPSARGSTLCKTGTAIELVFNFTLLHPGRMRGAASWKVERLRLVLQRYLGLGDTCQVDVMIGRRGQEWTPIFSVTEVAVTVTLHTVQSAAHTTLEALAAQAFVVGTAMATFSDSLLASGNWSLDPTVNVTLTTSGAAPVHTTWDLRAPTSLPLDTRVPQGLPRLNIPGLQSSLQQQHWGQQPQQALKPALTSLGAEGARPSAQSAHGTHSHPARHDAVNARGPPSQWYCIISDEQVHVNMRLQAASAYDHAAPASPPDLAASLLQGGTAGVRVDQLAVMVQGFQVLVSADSPADMPASRHGVLGTVTLNGVRDGDARHRHVERGKGW